MIFSMGPRELAILLIGVPVALAVLAFWIWMLVDCLVHESDEGNEKVAWTIVIVFLQVIGAILYFVVRRPRRRSREDPPERRSRSTGMDIDSGSSRESS